MNQGDVIKGKFQPKRTDDLRPAAKEVIGVEFEWRAEWLMGADDPFPGEWAMRALPTNGKPEPQMGWAPFSDVEPV